jgi:hypothetical protein
LKIEMKKRNGFNWMNGGIIQNWMDGIGLQHMRSRIDFDFRFSVFDKSVSIIGAVIVLHLIRLSCSVICSDTLLSKVNHSISTHSDSFPHKSHSQLQPIPDVIKFNDWLCWGCLTLLLFFCFVSFRFASLRLIVWMIDWDFTLSRFDCFKIFREMFPINKLIVVPLS